jgi:MEMO1 family protein
MSKIRFPEVAGAFYPASPDVALNDLRAAFANTFDPEIRAPKFLVLPHAGWSYCLPVMAQGLRAIHALKARFKKVVLIGPAHRVAFKGVATTSVNGWKTPFGDTAVDVSTINTLIKAKKITVADHAFAREHSLEVILPALQQILGSFQLIPLLVGDATQADVDTVIESVWGGGETLIVVSSDLSHFMTGKDAYEVDTATRIAIETMKPKSITARDACGHRGLNAVLRAAERRDYRITALDVRHSGQFTGDNNRVVGYGAFVGEPSLAARIPPHDRQHLINTAIDALGMAAKTGTMPQFNIPTALKPHFAAMRASFVTIKLDGKLRGCIGSLIPHRSLILDVATNAVKAGFQDPRFKPMTADELARAKIEISILSNPAPMSFKSEADLIAQLRPDVDGLIMRDGQNSGLFLPSVWESLPKAQEFLTGLKRKASLPETHWSNTLTIQRFTAEKFGGDYVMEMKKAA